MQETQRDMTRAYAVLDQLAARNEIIARQLSGLRDAVRLLADGFARGGKLLAAGNGGSCSDAEHIVGELMKGFVKKRPIGEDMARKLARVDEKRAAYLAMKLQGALPALTLNMVSLTSAVINDTDGAMCVAQHLYGLGRSGDVFLAISTSGNAENLTNAAVLARAMGISVLLLGGGTGGKLLPLADCALIAPESETYRVQEVHIAWYHALCMALEAAFFEE